MGHRPARVAEMIHKELASRLLLEVKDPRVTPVSITHVKVSTDLSVATVEYTPLGGGEPSDELVEGLASVARSLRGPIGRALRLRHAPELRFVIDRHTDEAVRMTNLLGKLEEQRADREEGE
ncbi:MAG: 30S ribosome-binding factor RbfA [Myxococcales bacterium]|nr:30S ribosome-binding factor RbfA [Myxococcales bacterium]MCB9693945.1 30S ribosome-binding factor RbfA [Alphaproteobacteria bacterium]